MVQPRNEEQVLEFMHDVNETEKLIQKISKCYSDIDYYEFIKRAQLEDSQKSLETFTRFRIACKGLLKIDPVTLTKVLS